MNVGRLEEKWEYDPRGHLPIVQNNQKSIGKSWDKGKPAILAEGGVVITMKSGGHRRGLLISTKH